MKYLAVLQFGLNITSNLPSNYYFGLLLSYIDDMVSIAQIFAKNSVIKNITHHHEIYQNFHCLPMVDLGYVLVALC